jgi:hypothetical protein
VTFDPAAIRAVTDVIQWLNLLCAVAILALCIGIGWKWRGVRAYLWLPLTFGLHGTVFYALALANAIPPPWGTLWSAVLRFHGFVVVLGVLAVVAIALWSPDEVENGE